MPKISQKYPDTVKTQTTPSTPGRFLLFVSKDHKKWAFGGLFLVTIAQLISSGSPYIFKIIIDGISSTSDKNAQIEILILWGSVYVASLAAMWFLWRLSGFIGMEWVIRSWASGQQYLYNYVTAHSHTYFLNSFAGAVAHKIDHAAVGASRLIDDFLWGHYDRVLSLLLTTALMFYTDPKIGFVFMMLVVTLVAINIPLLKRRLPYVVDYANSASALKGFGVDLLTNISTVRQYALRDRELHRIGDRVQEVSLKDQKQWRVGEWALLCNNAVIVSALGMMMFIMVRLFEAGTIGAGDVVLVLTLLFSSSGALTFIGHAMGGAIRRYGEVKEGLEAVLEPHEIVDVSSAQDMKVKKGEITWQDVVFEFGANKVFDDFNVAIASGQRVGLVGPSGAGKTTFVSLLLRQYDLTSGAIVIDGQNIADVTQDSLRKNIAVVPQEPLLFHRTIKENIAYGNPAATEQEITEAAKKAQADDFVASLPDGYETMVGERGVKLSGGQRQRIAIARAILKNAPILVLDEATSALDSESEVLIQKALHELMEGKTVIAIAHRLSTLREMDRILVLENGQIVEDGTHTELVAYGGTYASLWEHQAGGFLTE